MPVTVTNADAVRQDLTVPLSGEAVGAITGQIMDKGGNPAGGLLILNNLDNEVVGLGINSVESKFQFSGLPDGSYRLSASNEFYLSEEIAIKMEETKRLQDIRIVFNYPLLDLSKDNTVYSDDGVLKLSIPPETFTNRTGIIINKKSAGLYAASSLAGQYGDSLKETIYEVRAVASIVQGSNNPVTAGKKLSVGLRYSAGLNEHTVRQIKVHQLKENGWQKVAEGQSIDRAEGRAVCEAEELGTFRLSLSAVENLSDLKIYPNPYKPNSGLGHQGIVFSGLTGRSKIKIYTFTGELVRELDKDDQSGTYDWDVCNGAGEKLASGLYLYLVTGENGEKKTGKFAVVK